MHNSTSPFQRFYNITSRLLIGLSTTGMLLWSVYLAHALATRDITLPAAALALARPTMIALLVLTTIGSVAIMWMVVTNRHCPGSPCKPPTWLGMFWQALLHRRYSNELSFWWYAEVQHPLHLLRVRLQPAEACTDCRKPIRSWWRRVGDHNECAPF